MTQQERLFEKLKTFDTFFNDMAFAPDGNRPNCYEWFIFKVEPIDDINGCFSPLEQTIIISPESIEYDNVILHEMIHAYEFLLDELPVEHDVIYWTLYQDLKSKIHNIDDIITKCVPLLIDEHKELEGYHDVLFLLKSLDLDIRMLYPLGTVFSYGFTEVLKGFSYEAEGGRRS